MNFVAIRMVSVSRLLWKKNINRSRRKRKNSDFEDDEAETEALVKHNEEMEDLLYEEYRTEEHQIVVATLETEEKAVGIAVFQNQLRVEYYSWWVRSRLKCVAEPGEVGISIAMVSVWAYTIARMSKRAFLVLCAS